MGIDEETLNVLIGEYASSYGGEIEITKESCDKSHFTVHFSGRMCRSCGIEAHRDEKPDGSPDDGGFLPGLFCQQVNTIMKKHLIRAVI